MGFEQFYGVFPVKNTELKGLAEFLWEAGFNVGTEASASLTIGLNEHAETRIRQFANAAQLRLTAVASHPIPDLPRSHPVNLDCDISGVPDLPRTADGRAVNTDIEQVMVSFQRAAYELAQSNSAALGGGMIAFDVVRCESNIASIVDQLDALTAPYGRVDFAETAAPAATPAAKTLRAK